MPIVRAVHKGLWMSIAMVVALSAAAHAIYPTNTCVGQKLDAAATACQKELTIWATYEKDPSKDPGGIKRDAAIATAEGKLTTAWAKAEATASGKNADCIDTTVSSADMNTLVNAAVNDIQSTIISGASTLTDRKCNSNQIKLAGTACLKLLKAQSSLIKNLKGDPVRAKLAAAQAKAEAGLLTAWTKLACTTGTTEGTIAAKLDTLDTTAVADTTVSPNVANTWTMITPAASVPYGRQTLDPQCSDGSQYVFFVKAGTAPNKVLVYYYGGGACWDYFTCGPAQPFTYTKSTGSGDNPAGITTGLFDLSNTSNPFADWTMIAVPYCTADVHWGNATFTYQDTTSTNTVTIQHKGFVNAQVVEKWTREHFVNPDVVFVAGSSAGGYGALLNSLYLQQNVYQASKFYVFDDAGSGVITQAFQDTNLGQWGVQKTLPKWIPGFNKPLSKLSISQLASAAALFYARASFAQYTTAWDQVQTQFYNGMANGDADLLNWWHSTCAWDSGMRTLVQAAFAGAPANYRYYIGPGTRHTVLELDKVYTDAPGTLPTVIDWINGMLAGSSSWVVQDCNPNCDPEPGDPVPSPLVAPFEDLGGGAVGVSCP